MAFLGGAGSDGRNVDLNVSLSMIRYESPLNSIVSATANLIFVLIIFSKSRVESFLVVPGFTAIMGEQYQVQTSALRVAFLSSLVSHRLLDHQIDLLGDTFFTLGQLRRVTHKWQKVTASHKGT
jgi:hypothetical protein